MLSGIIIIILLALYDVLVFIGCAMLEREEEEREKNGNRE